jgi:hypothetical protein
MISVNLQMMRCSDLRFPSSERHLALFALMLLPGCTSQDAQNRVHGEEVQALVRLAERVDAYLEAQESADSPIWISSDRAKQELLGDWQEFGPSSAPELIVLYLALGHRAPVSVKWSFESAADGDLFQVVATRRPDERLHLWIERADQEWTCTRVEPVYPDRVICDQGPAEFAASFMSRLMAAQRALRAIPMVSSGDGMFIPNSGWAEFRLLQEHLVAGPGESAPLEPSGEWSSILTIVLNRWSFEFQQGLADGWEQGLVLDEPEPQEDGTLLVRANLKQSRVGSSVPLISAVELRLFHTSEGWGLVQEPRGLRREVVYEFQNDGKGSWNLEPPQRF